MLTWLKQRATEWERKSGEKRGKGRRRGRRVAGCHCRLQAVHAKLSRLQQQNLVIHLCRCACACVCVCVEPCAALKGLINVPHLSCSFDFALNGSAVLSLCQIQLKKSTNQQKEIQQIIPNTQNE